MFDSHRMISLVSTYYTEDDIGQNVPVEQAVNVLCRLRSVSMTEWSQASQLGLSAALQAVMWAAEYHGEEYVDIDSKRYHVYRTYDSGDRVELYLEEMTGHESQY